MNTAPHRMAKYFLILSSLCIPGVLVQDCDAGIIIAEYRFEAGLDRGPTSVAAGVTATEFAHSSGAQTVLNGAIISGRMADRL